MTTSAEIRQAFLSLILEAEASAALLIWPDDQGRRQDLLDAAAEARAALDAWAECMGLPIDTPYFQSTPFMVQPVIHLHFIPPSPDTDDTAGG